jgi:hypothetical protein
MVCEWFGLKTTQMVFAGLTSKPVVTVSGGLASKPAATVFSSLASKLVATVSPSLASKPAALVWWFGPQNYRDGFLVWASKPNGLRFVGCATKLMEEGRRETCVEI